MAHCALGQGSFRALVGAGRERPERGPRAEVIFGRSFAVKESGIMNIRGCETKRVFCFDGKNNSMRMVQLRRGINNAGDRGERG